MQEISGNTEYKRQLMLWRYEFTTAREKWNTKWEIKEWREWNV